MSDTKNELDVLFPGEDVQIKLRGQKEPEQVRIEPYYATQLKPAASKVRPIAQSLFEVVVVDGGKLSFKYSDGFADRLFDLIENGADALIDLVGFSIGKPREWFDGVSPDGLFDLAEAIVRQNKDFFQRRVLGALRPAMAAQAVGAQSSPA